MPTPNDADRYGETARRVMELGTSTLAMTLPAAWAREVDVEKGDDLLVRRERTGSLSVRPDRSAANRLPERRTIENPDPAALTAALAAAYVRGCRSIEVRSDDGLSPACRETIREFESLMLGASVFESGAGTITLRCSIDPQDFSVRDLLRRLDRTGRSVREAAVRAAVARDASTLPEHPHAERRAERLSALASRLLYTGHLDEPVARAIGLDDSDEAMPYHAVVTTVGRAVECSLGIRRSLAAAPEATRALDDRTAGRIEDANTRATAAFDAVIDRLDGDESGPPPHTATADRASAAESGGPLQERLAAAERTSGVALLVAGDALRELDRVESLAADAAHLLATIPRPGATTD